MYLRDFTFPYGTGACAERGGFAQLELPPLPENILSRQPLHGEIKSYLPESAELARQMRTELPHGFITRNTLTPEIVSQLPDIMEGVSLLISDYTDNLATKNEMLPKSPAQLYDAFLAGESVVYVAFDTEQNKYVPIGHAAVWGLLPKQTEQEYKVQIYEFGSWIVHRDFWHNKEVDTFGTLQITEDEYIGEAVAFELMQNIQEKNHPADTPGDGSGEVHYEVLATVKRENAMKGLKRIGFETNSFHEQKLLAGATCSCSTSEHYNNAACSHRRTPPDGERITLRGDGSTGYEMKDQYVPDGDGAAQRIPCTLLTNTETRDREIVRRVLLEHYLENNDSIIRGAAGKVSPDLAQKVFFQAVDTTTIIQPAHITMLEGLMNILGVTFK